MHFCMVALNARRRRRNEKGPREGPFSGSAKRGSSAGDGGEGRREGGAHHQEEGRDDTVEKPFKMRDSHDTHL
jgi:hypothetical protein